jgi:hypothetical protein
MSTVCLAMIARNEASVIARSLASAKPLVDAWVVVDTGSTDDTEAVARRAMEGVPGDVVHRSWRDFGANRTESIELARERADYVLVLDADDVLEYPPGARLPPLTEAGYQLVVHDGEVVYPRLQIFKSSLPWRYEGVVHEHAFCEGVERLARVDGIVYRRIGGGARSADPQKYMKDAALLEAESKRDPSNVRTVFMLAQSYEDGGELARALAQYERRALMGGWPEEVFLARLRAARVRAKMHLPTDAVIDAFLAAWRLRPHRAEPLFQLATICREAGDWLRAHGFALVASSLPFPRGDGLPVQHEVYAWRALDEYAAACVGLEEHAAAIDACRRLLARELPPAERDRVAANLASLEALPQP